jgi:hypothetical protein
MDVPLETILSTINNVVLIVLVIIALFKGWNLLQVWPLIENLK